MPTRRLLAMSLETVLRQVSGPPCRRNVKVERERIEKGAPDGETQIGSESLESCMHEADASSMQKRRDGTLSGAPRRKERPMFEAPAPKRAGAPSFPASLR
jgi:hypothetical protein